MSKLDPKVVRRQKLRWRVRSKVSGTQEKPRLSVFRSNKGIYAQLINDKEGKTLAAASYLDKDLAGFKGNKLEQSAAVGKAIAEKAKAAGVENVVFDRSGYLYHGRIQALAEAAREGGLKF